MNARSLSRQGIVGAILLAGIVLLPSCVGVPVGDPEKSKADSRFVGVWEWRDAQLNRAIIRAWDQKTYVIDVLSGVDTGTLQPRSRYVYKGWLTDIKGQTFLTMQPADLVGMMNGDERPKYYIVAKVKLEGTTLTALGLNTDFPKLKEAATSAALEQLIAENIEDPKLYATPIVATKWTPEQMKGLDKLVETFKEFKPQ
jgi:hypothetical protein